VEQATIMPLGQCKKCGHDVSNVYKCPNCGTYVQRGLSGISNRKFFFIAAVALIVLIGVLSLFDDEHKKASLTTPSPSKAQTKRDTELEKQSEPEGYKRTLEAQSETNLTKEELDNDLLKAAENGQTEKVLDLIKAGASVNVSSKRILNAT
jgi:hypothetical protein